MLTVACVMLQKLSLAQLELEDYRVKNGAAPAVDLMADVGATNESSLVETQNVDGS